MAQRFATVDEYIGSFPPETQVVLQEVRRTIHDAVPSAGETISYHMPTITVNGKSVLGFAGWKHHVGLYPVPTVDEELAREIAPYRWAKSTLRFPLREPVPYQLIGRVVMLLAQQRVAS